jgi:hypothetical protein
VVAANTPLRPLNYSETVTSFGELERQALRTDGRARRSGGPGGEGQRPTRAPASSPWSDEVEPGWVRRGGAAGRLPGGGRGAPLKPEVEPLGPGDGGYYRWLTGKRRTT